MSTKTAVSAFKAVEQHTKYSERLHSAWKTADEDNLQSVVGSVQIFSDIY